MTKKLSTEEFKKLVFDFEAGGDWKYSGDLPAIIDFYADWCGPCKMVAPVLEKLSAKYSGRLHVYKVDTESEQELAALFDIRSIPTIFFVPMEGEPRFAMGALPEKDLEHAIVEVLKVSEKAPELVGAQ